MPTAAPESAQACDNARPMPRFPPVTVIYEQVVGLRISASKLPTHSTQNGQKELHLWCTGPLIKGSIPGQELGHVNLMHELLTTLFNPDDSLKSMEKGMVEIVTRLDILTGYGLITWEISSRQSKFGK
jgi:hypothetical protein